MAKEAGRLGGGTGRITKTSVEALPLPVGTARNVLWDAELKGFGVRTTSNGKRTYFLRYRMGGRDAPQRFITIGQHGSPLTADQARRRAFELMSLVRTGVDPAGERERAREEAATAGERREKRLFARLADGWFERHVKDSLRSEKDIRGVLERDLKPAFADLSIDEITRSRVGEALESIGLRSRSAANKAHKWLRQMFNSFVEKGLLEHSPLERVKRPFAEGSRTRVLNLLELVVVWEALEAVPEPFRLLYRSLILLGQRLREVSNLPWEELDLDAAEWILPAARAKNGRDHLIPLSEQALAVLRERAKGRKVLRGPVFTTDGRVGISGFSKMKEAIDVAVEEVLGARPEAAAVLGGGLDGWVVHDLRRSLATGCQAMGIPVEVTEAVLNHVSGRQGGVRGVYQTYDYFDEKAAALAAWGASIEKALVCWRRGDVEAILQLDPVRSARRRRQVSRSIIGIPKDTKA